MIHRLYINNYRCLQNFDIDFSGQSSVLIIGKNGTGKSAIADALSMLRSIGQHDRRVNQFLDESDFAFGNTEAPIRIELSAELDGTKYEYSLAMEWPENFKEPRVKAEHLIVNGDTIYKRVEEQIDLVVSDVQFMMDWHFVALPLIGFHGGGRNLDRFRNWLASLVILAPLPQLFQSTSVEDTLYPARSLSNFADWFCGIIGEYPAAYGTIESFLKMVMPDFQEIQSRAVGESAKKITVHFKHGPGAISLALEKLSDGEKAFFVCAVLLALNKYRRPLFCFWDEPDNFVSISEVGHMILMLTKAFQQSGQVVVTSHNPEAVLKFMEAETLVLRRKTHLEPTKFRWLCDLKYREDLIESLIIGDLEDGM